MAMSSMKGSYFLQLRLAMEWTRRYERAQDNLRRSSDARYIEWLRKNAKYHMARAVSCKDSQLSSLAELMQHAHADSDSFFSLTIQKLTGTRYIRNWSPPQPSGAD